jgi:hypothetical protein
LFNVVEDSKSSSFDKRWDNMIQTTSKDPLKVSDGSITRSKAK